MTTQTNSKQEIIISALMILLLILSGYLGYKTLTLTKALEMTSVEKQTEITEKNKTLQSLLETQQTLEAIQEELSLTAEDLDELEDDYRKEKNKNEKFEDQIDQLMGTVGDLDKLSKTDEELLVKYSKVYFLNENYTPSNIKQIDSKYILEGRDNQFFHGDALPFLEKMIDRAERSDVDLKIASAYRSFDTQAALKGAYTQTYGSGANAFSADQGYSEHQLGTTLDITTPTVGGTYLSFQDTEAYTWLQRNAHRYGFTLSYPDDNGFYIFEPWHWRFVGTDLAEYLHDEKISFYDMDQRDIDTYLIKIFD